MARRAKLLGLDIQPSGWDGRNEEVDENGRPVVHVEIVNDPETKRREWLFQQRILALGGNPDIDGDDETPGRSRKFASGLIEAASPVCISLQPFPGVRARASLKPRQMREYG
jgi:hypothetical protein